MEHTKCFIDKISKNRGKRQKKSVEHTPLRGNEDRRTAEIRYLRAKSGTGYPVSKYRNIFFCSYTRACLLIIHIFLTNISFLAYPFTCFLCRFTRFQTYFEDTIPTVIRQYPFPWWYIFTTISKGTDPLQTYPLYAYVAISFAPRPFSILFHTYPFHVLCF